MEEERLLKHITHKLEEYGMPKFKDQLPAMDILQYIKDAGYTRVNPTNTEGVTHKDRVDDFKQYYQANLLDGDSIDDCGNAMLNAKDVFEVVVQYIEKELEKEREKVTKLATTYGAKAYIEKVEKQAQEDLMESIVHNPEAWSAPEQVKKCFKDVIEKVEREARIDEVDMCPDYGSADYKLERIAQLKGDSDG